VQAASIAEAAANEKLRRARRGDDGFNGFSSDNRGDVIGASGAVSAFGAISCKWCKWCKQSKRPQPSAAIRRIVKPRRPPAAIPCAVVLSLPAARAHHKSKRRARVGAVMKRCRGSPQAPWRKLLSHPAGLPLAVRTRAGKTGSEGIIRLSHLFPSCSCKAPGAARARSAAALHWRCQPRRRRLSSE
jgi:hypothetical protein